MGAQAVVARAAVHCWEEPCISGRNGSGTIFFSGCALRCVYCQNHEISSTGFGKEVSVGRLREMMAELAAQGVHNINLVTPTHFAEAIGEALEVKPPVPVLWNSSGYDKAATLKSLAGKIQIYLPDFKYADDRLGVKYSAAPHYSRIAQDAIREMFRQTGPYVLDADGLMQSGVLIRHLMLPGQGNNTLGVIDWVADTFRQGEVLFSLMSQYTPRKASADFYQCFPELSRRIAQEEYEAAANHLLRRGITEGFVQEMDSANAAYTPAFDLTGVE